MASAADYARMNNNELAQAIGARESLIRDLSSKDTMSAQDRQMIAKAKRELAGIEREVDNRNEIKNPISSDTVNPEGFRI